MFVENSMIYSPVLIATVNRYQRFKECIESLSCCIWANKTDVFVAVDYPPNEKYWEGYNQIKKYLEKCGDLGFKSLNVIYRETNYFYTVGNFEALIDEILESYDRFILSEDDNVFSPNFLVFMNKGLEKFKDDPTVLAINGYRHFYPLKINKNSFLRQNVDFSAWGYGIWRDRYMDVVKCSREFFFYNTFSVKNALRLLNNGANRFCQYLDYSKSRTVVPITDDFFSVYMAFKNMDVVMPSLSTVRNKGWDKSGIHFKPSNHFIETLHMSQLISAEPDFIYEGSGLEYYSQNKEIYKKCSYGRKSVVFIMRSVISFFLCRYLKCVKK